MKEYYFTTKESSAHDSTLFHSILIRESITEKSTEGWSLHTINTIINNGKYVSFIVMEKEIPEWRTV